VWCSSQRHADPAMQTTWKNYHIWACDYLVRDDLTTCAIELSAFPNLAHHAHIPGAPLRPNELPFREKGFDRDIMRILRLDDCGVPDSEPLTWIDVSLERGLSSTSSVAPMPLATDHMAELVPTNTLPARSYSGEKVSVMYHGTDSRAAQLIATSQRFLPSGTGLLGPGIYMTRTRQKAEGYRVHHPGAGVADHSVSTHNLPLPSGEEDPGCILKFKVQLGACKRFTRDCDSRELTTWHDTPVPELAKTSSMKEAVTGIRTISGSDAIRYNSAFSAGCSCCRTHGGECPGSPENNHRPLPGQEPCMGRCPTGFRNCPVANTSFEEYALANTERISHIEIVAGPPGLVGYGPEL
jgi:hypothetical protein